MKALGYQAEAVDTAATSLSESNRALVIMATGLGKTFVAASTFKKLRKSNRSLRNLVLCHDNDILEQSEPTFRAVLGESTDIGFFTGEKKEGANAEIVFSTFQVLREWKDAFLPGEFGLITVDEAHHSQAVTFKDVIEYFDAPRLGLTAMRDRMDEKDIAEIFGDPVVNIPLDEAIARGLLTPFEYRVVSDGLDTGAIRILTREIKEGVRYTLADLNKALFIKARDEEIVEKIKKEAVSRKTLVFCRNIQHANTIADMLGSKAHTYHSKNNRTINKDVLASFRQGHIQFLVAVNKANEGVDIPDAEVVVFLRTTESKTVLFQQLGRSLRKIPGKRKALLLDFVGNVERLTVIQDLIRRLGELKGLMEYEKKETISISGEGFEFHFIDTLVEMLDIVAMIRQDFYPTWQEASAVAKSLGIRNLKEYRQNYLQDSRLPAFPNQFYEEYPGARVFFGGSSFYPTWQEASAAAEKLGLTNSDLYKCGYKKDPRLPSKPFDFYADFPGWRIFGGRYLDWRMASKAAARLGIKDLEEYRKRYQEDPKLPAWPSTFYEDWPGYKTFFKKRNRS